MLAIVGFFVINPFASIGAIALGILYLVIRNASRRQRRLNRADEQRRRQAI